MSGPTITTMLEADRFELDCAEKVLADALDRFRKRELDLREAWNSVEQALSRVSRARTTLATYGTHGQKLPTDQST